MNQLRQKVLIDSYQSSRFNASATLGLKIHMYLTDFKNNSKYNYICIAINQWF